MAAKQLDPDRLSYSVIERALALVFGADETAQRGWLRGRIQNLRKLGLAPPSLGAGRAIGYTQDDADRWLIGIEFGFLHVDPSTSAAVIQEHWGHLKKLAEEARESDRLDNDVIVSVRFSPAMSEMPDIGHTTMRGLDSFGHWLRDQRIGVSVFNLSALIRAFDKALVEAAKPPPPKPTGLAKAILDAAKKAKGEK
jgi:hypothetical protein